jgi:hypothetical protein
MSRIATIAVLAITLCTFVAACGTADNGAKTASPTDAQVAPAAEIEDAPAPGPPEPALIPKPNGPGAQPAADAPSGGPCATAADCVAASCCHSKTCVAKAQKLSCANVMCTMDCRFGTMDCGGGNCICKDGECAAELKKPGFVKGVEEAAKPQ